MKNCREKLVIEGPIRRWDEALPAGNGQIGVLVWGDEKGIKLSLDRGDLWDTRSAIEKKDFTWAKLKELVGSGNEKQIKKIFDEPYYKPYPTKLPAGRIELELEKGDEPVRFELRLEDGVVRVETRRGSVEVLCCERGPVCIARVKGCRVKIKIKSPFEGKDNGAANSTARLEYRPGRKGRRGDIAWFEQECAEGLCYAVAAASRKNGDAVEIAAAIEASRNADSPAGLARELAGQFLEAGFEKCHAENKRWWKRFWAKSAIEVPDKEMQRQYYMAQYYYGSASRRDFPAMPLQGLWTADEGTLPPWKGDYHHDLNTQMTYWAYQCANHMDEGACFTDFMWKRMDVFRRFAREFYGTGGACVPGVMTIDGQAMGGWPQYSLSPTNSAWVAHNFYLHWRYSMDRDFLRTEAYPFCSETAVCLSELLEKGSDGKMHLPLTSSPEIHDDRLDAWLGSDSNYDLSLVRWLIAATAEMAGELGFAKEKARFLKILESLPGLAVEEGKGLLVCEGEALNESHRHFSHAMAIYPLGLLDVESGEKDSKVIMQTLRELDRLGTGQWVGFSFAWMACMSARCGMGDRAAAWLDVFYRAFVSMNGFNLNGDFKNLGFSWWKYRPFTLEANFAAAQAINEMLLQSWGGKIRVFAAMPGRWQDARFRDLRVEGAFLVSAQRKAGKTLWVEIRSEKGGRCVLSDPFDGAKCRWEGKRPVAKKGGEYNFEMKAGDVVKGRI